MRMVSKRAMGVLAALGLLSAYVALAACGSGPGSSLDFNMSVAPDPLNIAVNNVGTATITVTRLAGFSKAVDLTFSVTAPLDCGTSISPATLPPTATTATITCSSPSSVTEIVNVFGDRGKGDENQVAFQVVVQ